MAQITVTVNQRSYSIACDDGEEAHLQDLARFVDAQILELTRNVGQIGEARLLLMGALVVADQLAEADEKIETLEQRLAAAEGRPAHAPEKDPSALAARLLQSAADRIEALAARLEHT